MRSFPSKNRSTGFIAILALLFYAQSAMAQPKEYLVKAAFIYNFTKFIEWPQGKETLNICVLGENLYQGALKQIESRSNEKSQYKLYQNPVDPSTCHIQIINQALETSGQLNGVLSIGEGEGFLSNGGVVSFLEVDNKVKFAVNLTEARKRGLTINPQLLEVAQRVIK